MGLSAQVAKVFSVPVKEGDAKNEILAQTPPGVGGGSGHDCDVCTHVYACVCVWLHVT